MTDDRYELRCTNSHDRCGDGLAPCPYCEPVRVRERDPDRLRDEQIDREIMERDRG